MEVRPLVHVSEHQNSRGDRLINTTDLELERETYFTPGHINSYRRDRYERWDELTQIISRVSKKGEEHEGPGSA